MIPMPVRIKIDAAFSSGGRHLGVAMGAWVHDGLIARHRWRLKVFETYKIRATIHWTILQEMAE